MGTRKTNVPAIPSIGRSANQIDAVLKAAKEAIEVGYGRRGDPLDRFVTIRELRDAGLAGVSAEGRGIALSGDGSAGGTGAPGAPVFDPDDPDFGDEDYTRPPAPTGVEAHHIAPSGMMVTWNPPGYHNHAYAEVFRMIEAGRDPDGAPVPPEFAIGTGGFKPQFPVSGENAQPSFAGRAAGTIYTDEDLLRKTPENTDPLEAALEPTTYYYWVRFVSTAGVTGPYAPLNGAAGQLSIDPSRVLGLLITNITDSSLYTDLIGSYFNTDQWNPIVQAGGLADYIAQLDDDLHNEIDAQLVRLIGKSDNPDGGVTLIQHMNTIEGQADENEAQLNDISLWQAALSSAVGDLGSSYQAATVVAVDTRFGLTRITLALFSEDPRGGVRTENNFDNEVINGLVLHAGEAGVLQPYDGMTLSVGRFGSSDPKPEIPGVMLVAVYAGNIPALPETDVSGKGAYLSFGTGGTGSDFVDFVASVYKNVFVKVDEDSAIAQAIDVVEARVGENESSIQQTSQTLTKVDGYMDSLWTVKMRQITGTGLVTAAGFGLGMEHSLLDEGTDEDNAGWDTISSFIINADQFAIMGSGKSGAVITRIAGQGATANVTLDAYEGVHGIKQGDDVVFMVTETVGSGQANPLSPLSGAEASVDSVNGYGVNVTFKDGTTYNRYHANIADAKNALMPAPNVPFVVDTEHEVVGVRGKLVVDGLVRATAGDFDTLTANTAFVRKLQAEVLNANVVIGQRIIAGVPDIGAIGDYELPTDPGYGEISNFIVELNNPVTSSFPMRYWKPPSFAHPQGQMAWGLDRDGNVFVGGNMSIGDNATVRTTGTNMFSLGGSGADYDYAMWIGPADRYGDFGDGRTVDNAIMYVTDTGSAGFNVDVFLGDDPLVLPSIDGTMHVESRRHGASSVVYGSAVITLFDNLSHPETVVLHCELFLVPQSYIGSGSRSENTGASRQQPVGFLDEHVEIMDTWGNTPAPPGAIPLAVLGVDETAHQHSISIQGANEVPAGDWKLFARISRAPNEGDKNPNIGTMGFYGYMQQVRMPDDGSPPGAYLTGATNNLAALTLPPVEPSNIDMHIPVFDAQDATNILRTDGERMYWDDASGLAKDDDVVHIAGAETVTGDKTFTGDVLLGGAVLPSAGVVDIGASSNGFGHVYAVRLHGSLDGNADTASAWESAITLTLGGDLSGSAQFDGSAGFTVTATVNTIGGSVPGDIITHDAADFVSAALVGVANGVTPLDATGKVSTTFLPDSILGGVKYQGSWDASGASDPSASPAQGEYWIVTTAGSHNLSGITDWNAGDWAIYNGTAWDKVDNTDSVTSVAGLYGAVSTASLQNALNLDSAAYQSSSAFATAAQGATADSALQPGDGLGALDSAADAKLDGVDAGAEVNVQSDWLASSGDSYIKNKPTIPDAPGDIGAQPSDPDLSAVAHLIGTGYAKRTGVNTWDLSASVPWNDIIGEPVYATRWPAVSEVSGLPNALAGKADDSDIPTNNTQLTNGRGYVTTDTNTIYSAGAGLALAGTQFNVRAASGTLLGRYSAGTGNAQGITLGSGLNLSGSGELSASGGTINPNLYDNPNGEFGLTEWEVGARASFTLDTVDQYPAVCMTATASGVAYGYAWIPVVGGETYSIAWDALEDSTGQGALQIRWATANKVVGGPVEASESFDAPDWGRKEVANITAPPSAAFIRLGVTLDAATTGEHYWVRRIKLERGPVCTSFTDRNPIDLASALQSKFDDPAGSTAQYVRGDGSLATLPTPSSGDITRVVAGNGLTGGGQSGNVTVGMGTPGTCSASASNNVSANSHTHNITGFLPLTGGTLTGTLSGTTIQGSTIRDTSDRRLKRDITPLTGCTNPIMRLQPVSFRRAATERFEIGLIAQDVAKEFPEAVGTLEAADGTEYKTLAYQRLVAPLIDVVQQQQKRIEALEAAVRRLQA